MSKFALQKKVAIISHIMKQVFPFIPIYSLIGDDLVTNMTKMRLIRHD